MALVLIFILILIYNPPQVSIIHSFFLQLCHRSQQKVKCIHFNLVANTCWVELHWDKLEAYNPATVKLWYTSDFDSWHYRGTDNKQTLQK